MSANDFKLNSVFGVRWESSFFYFLFSLIYPVDAALFIEKTINFLLMCSSTLTYQGTISMYICFWNLYHIPVVCLWYQYYTLLITVS